MKLDVERVRLNQGGYDRRGRYWGVGERLFRVTSDEELPGYNATIDEHVRAASAREAREKVARMYRLERSDDTTSRDPRRSRRRR